MKNLCLLFALIILGCSPKATNDFDQIIHYSITDSLANKLKNDQRFSEIYSSINAHKINYEVFENELAMYGFSGKSLPSSTKEQVNEHITNTLYYDGHLVACVPFYRDILI